MSKQWAPPFFQPFLVFSEPHPSVLLLLTSMQASFLLWSSIKISAPQGKGVYEECGVYAPPSCYDTDPKWGIYCGNTWEGFIFVDSSLLAILIICGYKCSQYILIQKPRKFIPSKCTRLYGNYIAMLCYNYEIFHYNFHSVLFSTRLYNRFVVCGWPWLCAKQRMLVTSQM